MLKIIAANQPLTKEDLVTGGCFLVDKPLHWTSFDVVNKLRYSIRHLLGRKKYKIGHAGTLDPLATGLLLICFSKATKSIESLMTTQKTYEGEMTLWATTPCYDREQPIDCYYPAIQFSVSTLRQEAAKLTGEIDQSPPMFSAIKKDGVALYKLARAGKKITLKSRPVTIHRFDLTDIHLPKVRFEVVCSKGTYIRSLAHDFGQNLGSGAYLSALRRTKVGDYNVNDAWSVEELVSYIKNLN